MAGSYGETFDGKILDDLSGAWVEKHNWSDILRRLTKIKFALQADRDMIPGIVEDLSTEIPVDENTRFPSGKVYHLLTKEMLMAIEAIHAASSFKRRAEEKNNVNPRQRFEAESSSSQLPSGGLVVRPAAGSGDSSLGEDLFSNSKLDDASTAFHKSLATLKGSRPKAVVQRTFEKEYSLRWTAAAPVAAAGGTPPGGGRGPGT
uniref:Coat protein n=1 Tax=Tobacco rattle virus TaxID=12295 RepID=Q6EHZ8_9VIRU|nr:coat protein [Tobacco rattle virus]ADU05336.1 coat protein [Tobacco rattle virus]ADU05338.1 coat protein [Tobacco rattle virus]ADU05340.1 coat protein [Tobacco rattle virus]ADU05344.1 coat protein [Tobacco rattle virus]